MVEKLKVNALLRDIEKYLNDLESFFPIDEDRFEEDLKLQYSIAFLLEQIVNECINLGNHVLSSLDLEPPSTFSEIFENLARASLISKKNSEAMKEFVRVRNLIAHRYGKISREDLVKATKEVGGIKIFIKDLLEHLEGYL